MTIGYKIDYTRKNYSRGKMQLRDFVYEGIIAPKCRICGVSIERPYGKNNRPLRIRDWLKRKHCSKNCELKWRHDTMNKGIAEKLKCEDCGKQLYYYSHKLEKIRKNKCRNCYLKFRKTPEGKKIFSKYLFCTIVGCNREHDSKGMCSKHYQYSLSKNHKIGRPRKNEIKNTVQ